MGEKKGKKKRLSSVKVQSERQVVSQSAFARLLGITPQSVKEMIQSGKITAHKSATGRVWIHKDQAIEQYRASTLTPKNNAGIGSSAEVDKPRSIENQGGLNYQKARAAREAAVAKLTMLELEKKTGKLVDVSDVRSKWLEISRIIKTAYQALPDRVSSLLTAVSDEIEIHKILSEEIDRILENLANGQKF